MFSMYTTSHKVKKAGLPVFCPKIKITLAKMRTTIHKSKEGAKKTMSPTSKGSGKTAM